MSETLTPLTAEFTAVKPPMKPAKLHVKFLSQSQVFLSQFVIFLFFYVIDEF